jgi:signal transduction histidine kinase
VNLTLYRKFLVGYLLFGILGFTLVSTFSSNIVYSYLISSTADNLYTQAVNLATESARYYEDDMIELSSLSAQLGQLSSWVNADIWFIDKQGTIVYDSCESHLSHTISNFDAASCTKQGYFCTGTFYNQFTEDYLSVLAPITVGYSIKGYIILHTPLELILEEQYNVLNLIYVTAALIFILSLIILGVFHFVVYLPVKKINLAAEEYASGNLTYHCEVNTSDELGYLSNTLNYMSSELANAEEYQKNFISNVSHDFRSPLTSIQGYIVAILDGTIPPERQNKYLQIVINETKRLANLTQSLLTLNKLDGKTTRLSLTNFDINRTIRDTCATFEGTCKQRLITLDLTFYEESLTVYADMGRIQQVLYNLIDNAIKFSHDSSVIWIETYTKNGKVFVSVKDEGCGIPKENIKKIWERFYKADISRGKDKKGTGLGLAITKEIISAHNQNIDVISTEGVGTEFIFTLPKA